MPRLWAFDGLEKEVGGSLGRGSLLLIQMPERASPPEIGAWPLNAMLNELFASLPVSGLWLDVAEDGT